MVMPAAIAHGGDAAVVEFGAQLFMGGVAERAKVIDDTGNDAGRLVGLQGRFQNSCAAGCQ